MKTNIRFLVLVLTGSIYGLMMFVSSICGAVSYPTSTATPLASDLSMNQYNLTDVGDIITKGPWVDVRAYASFSAAIDAIGTSKKTLLIPDMQSVTADKTVPSNVTLWFLQGGKLDVSANVTMTINGSISATLTQIFSGSGTVKFGSSSVKEIYPQWWGAVGDGSADDTTAINKALASLATYGQTDPGGVLLFPTGAYKTTSTIYVPADITIRGSGSRYQESSRIVGTHTGAAVLSLKGAIDVTIENLVIEGNSITTPKTGLCFGRVNAASAGSHRIEDVAVTGYFSVAAIYSIASEENKLSFLRSSLLGGGAKYVFYTSQSDDLSVDSLYGSTNSGIWVENFSFINESTAPDAVGIYMNTGAATSSWSFRDGFIAQKNNAYVFLGVGTVDAQDCNGPIIFENIAGEPTAGGSPVYAFYLGGFGGTHILANLKIENCGIALFGGALNYIYGNNSLVLDSAQLIFNNINSATQKPSSVFELKRSMVNLSGQTFTVRNTAQTNIIVGGTVTISGASVANLLLEAEQVKGGITGRAGVDKFRMLTNTWLYGVTSPTSGTWAQGDIVYNTTPTAGGPLGWKCTVAGTPGTWVPFGGQAAAQADSTANNTSELKADFNALLSKLRAAGLMAP